MEIEKLRQRLKNVAKNVVEYRMTITEARALVEEFDNLAKKVNEKPKVLEDVGHIKSSVWDCGEF